MNPRSWPAYIAKVGHKWYPCESITEHLMTRIGQTFGIRMAESRLMTAAGQIRFLSRYFLEDHERLVHGSEIFEAYLEDRTFVQEVDQRKLAGDVFTFQVICDAIRTIFADDFAPIVRDFVKMLAFDTLVGNHDRHINNWGVIVDVRGERRPRFSPVYDTARGLFWNHPERDLPKRRSPTALRKYVEGARPQIGWDGASSPNHFELISRICSEYPELGAPLCDLGTGDALNAVTRVLNEEFGELMSTERRALVADCVALRAGRFSETVRDTCGTR